MIIQFIYLFNLIYLFIYYLFYLFIYLFYLFDLGHLFILLIIYSDCVDTRRKGCLLCPLSLACPSPSPR
jgi:hypothetical protein